MVPGFINTKMVANALTEAQDPQRASYTGAAALARMDRMFVGMASKATPPGVVAAAVVRAVQRKGGPPWQVEVGSYLSMAKLMASSYPALRDWIVNRRIGLLPRARAAAAQPEQV